MTDIGRLKELEEHFHDCVEEAVREAKDDADQFDKVLWKVLRLYLTTRPSFNWADYDDGITADQVYDFLIEDASEMDDSNAHLLSEIETLRARLAAALAVLQELVNYDNGGSGDGGAILDAAEKILASHKENADG